MAVVNGLSDICTEDPKYPTLHWCCDLCTCAFDEQSFISLHVHEDVPLICTINDEYGTIAWQMDLSKTLLLRK